MLGELEKLDTNLGGVADMKSLPDAIFVVDLRKEQIAIREARRLGLPVVGLVDTNCDPDDADYVIPGNDDAIRSCSLIVRVIADAVEAGKGRVTEEELATANGRPEEEQAEEAEQTPTAEEEAPPGTEQTPTAEEEAPATAEQPAAETEAPAAEETPTERSLAEPPEHEPLSQDEVSVE